MSVKKILFFLKSMQFSFILLFLIIACCIAGSVIPQGETLGAYMRLYGEGPGSLIFGLGFGNIFECPLFVVLTALLSFNLVLCSISRFPSLLKRSRLLKEKNGHFPIGIYGSWITHLGILFLIIGFAAGRILSEEYTLYGIAGSTQPIEDTGMTLTIDSFDVDLRDDFTVEQYTAGITVTDQSGRKESGFASVNHPLNAFGYSFYQDSTGWASYVDIYKKDTLLGSDLLCVGEYTGTDEMPGLVCQLYNFYPDLATDADGKYYSRTPLLNNPSLLYAIYFNNRMIDMNMVKEGALIPVNEFSFAFRDPTEYTLLVIKRDPTIPFVAAAALLILAGLFISFYIKPLEEKKYAGFN